MNTELCFKQGSTFLFPLLLTASSRLHGTKLHTLDTGYNFINHHQMSIIWVERICDTENKTITTHLF